MTRRRKENPVKSSKSPRNLRLDDAVVALAEKMTGVPGAANISQLVEVLMVREALRRGLEVPDDLSALFGNREARRQEVA